MRMKHTMNFNNISTGTDIEEIARFEKYEIGKARVLEKIFTPSEIEYASSKARPSQHLAVRFSAKESIIKALSSFEVKGLLLKDIEIYHDENSSPCVRILKPEFERFSFKLSLSHCNEYAVAYVIAFKEGWPAF